MKTVLLGEAIMRNHAVVALSLLLVLPGALSAQRRVPGTSRRPGVAEPGRQPEVIARASALQRSRWAMETYPMVSYVSQPAFTSSIASTHWTTLGSGTHAEYRALRSLAATIDVTTSLLGGPTSTQTIETGSRYRPFGSDHAIRPFVDVRAAYVQSGGLYGASIEDAALIGNPSLGIQGTQFSRGFGGVAGAGAEYSLTRNFALTTGVTAVRSRMSTYRFTGGSSLPFEGNYTMTSYRLALGIRFNPTRSFENR